MTDDASGELRVELVVDDADTAELDRLTANLRGELLQLDVDDVTPCAKGRRHRVPGLWSSSLWHHWLSLLAR